ncbi:phage head closure protein [Hafnia alvei]|uniref:phage head closure protein n=1 Tax=Hafnia alvei TaxID=569 RepID=UPI0024327274|nr:phage head closure protein [Hafnia alvei]
MKTLSASELTHRITLRRVEQHRGPLGEPLPSEPIDVATVWANAKAMSNRKIRTADQQQVIETYHFTLRPRADVAQDWQVVLGGQIFTVRTTDRTSPDRLVLKTEADVRHDRTGH